MLHEHDDVNLAIKDFEKKFKDKTNNKWSERANFKQKGKYNMVLMDDGDEDSSAAAALKRASQPAAAAASSDLGGGGGAGGAAGGAARHPFAAALPRPSSTSPPK